MATASPCAVLIVLSAPSGGGKTTVCQQLLARGPGVVRAVTCTTRAPRPGEQPGVDYYFLDPEEFRRREEAGEFLEHATVYGQRYGTLRAEVGNRLRAGQAVILAIDVQGAAQVRARARADAVLARALVTVFLTPPSLQLLEERLRKRGTEAPEVMARRLAAAREELTHCRHFDYVILSGTIAEDVRRLEAILEAERLRTTRVPLPEL